MLHMPNDCGWQLYGSSSRSQRLPSCSCSPRWTTHCVCQHGRCGAIELPAWRLSPLRCHRRGWLNTPGFEWQQQLLPLCCSSLLACVACSRFASTNSKSGCLRSRPQHWSAVQHLSRQSWRQWFLQRGSPPRSAQPQLSLCKAAGSSGCLGARCSRSWSFMNAVRQTSLRRCSG